MLDKAKALVADNKATVVKVGAIVLGGLVGAIVATALTAEPSEFFELEEGEASTEE